MKKIFITGSTGFVGQALVRLLDNNAYVLTAAVRQHSEILPKAVSQFFIGDINACADCSKILSEVEVVIHLAARVHVMKDESADPLEAFRLTNTTATLNLARQAAAAGVKRFVFLSSVKVNGEFSAKGKPFTPEDDYIPSDPYGLSKYAAEKGLLEIADKTDMEVVIIRPPLVYGAGVKGNFLQMIRWVSKGIPLPLGAMQSQRSLVALDNLTNLIYLCIDHPAAAGEIFLVSDDKDVTTTYLLKKIGTAVGKPARLLPIPQGLLTTVLNCLGQRAISQRLCTSLQVDISKTKTLLGWKPVVDMDDALDKTAKAWLKKQS
jgi:UDP-glucose 4-epimerase